MNILMFTRCMGEGGTEKIIIQLCESLIQSGDQVVVCADGGKKADKLKEMGVCFYRIPDMHNKSPQTALTIISTLKKIVRQHHIEIIHAHHRMAAFYCHLIGIEKKCKLMATCHNTFHDKHLLTKISYRNFALVACGEKVKENLEEEYHLHGITVINNSIKEHTGDIIIDPILKRDKEAGFFMVANIGRIAEQKGMEYFVKAFNIVKNKHRRVKFYIIGSGEKEKEIKELAATERADVSFLGFRKDVLSIIAQMDLVVLSSLWEGFPLTPIETFSMGKTIVATNVDGTSEIVRNGENGLLISPRSTTELAEKICWMIEHPEERKKMEEEARKTYQEKFSLSVFVESYMEFYRRLFNAGKQN